MNSREIIRRLEAEGFVLISQRGSHCKMRHADGRQTVIPHPKKGLPVGTVKAIEKQTCVKF